MTDDQLIEAVTRGDHCALRELFDRHAPWLAARLRRSLSSEAVEDVLQETFIAVWRGAGRYRSEGAVGAWLWGIARKQAALWARRQGRPHLWLEDERVNSVSQGADDPGSVAARNVDLEVALATLGPPESEQRELVRLWFVEDRSIADIAAHFSIPCGTVKSRVYKVRHLLQAALRQAGYGG